MVSDCLWWINWYLWCRVGEGCVLQKWPKSRAIFIFFLSLSILFNILSFFIWVKMAFEASSMLPSVSQIKFQNALHLCVIWVWIQNLFILFFYKKKVKHAVFSLYKHERWQAVHMKEECEATWADYHTPHQRALRFQLMWLAAVLHAKFVIEPVHHIPVQYHEVACHVEENIQLNTAYWRYYMAKSVTFTSVCAICNEVLCWQAVFVFLSLGHVQW